MSETLHRIDELTSMQIKKANNLPAQKESGKQNYYANRKANKSSSSNEMDLIKKLNKTTSLLIKQNFKRTSVFSMVFRSLFYISLFTSLFFYWDINHNKSVYTNLAQKKLSEYGLLDQTLKLINSIKKLWINLQNLINYYVPIWYNKANQTVIPFIRNCWMTTKEYTYIAWLKSEPYRQTTIVYFNKSIEYINENFPVLVKNLISIMELTIDYATTLYSFIGFYVSYGLDYIGTQLLGWKKGAMEKIFLDAFKVFLEYLTKFFQWIDSNITKNL